MTQKPLSLNEIRSRAAQFVIDWRESPGDEKQEAQSFVRELLHVYGITENRAAFYEKRAQRASTGRQGFIDALVPGQLLVEMKSASFKSLPLAENQALDYYDSLAETEEPRYVLTSNFKRFRLLDLQSPKGQDVTEFDLEELPRFADALAFLAGYNTRAFGSREQEAASVKAAKLMAELYESLEGSGFSDHDASIFLVRTLFSLYADDSGVWERDLFTEFLETRTAADGSDLGSQLSTLYQVMNQPQRSGAVDELVARFPYVNGGIFAEPLQIPFFDRAVRDTLLRAARFDWREISPAIFGSLFQAVKSPEARRSLGEHYTTEANIMKTLAPLFLDELHEQLDAARHSIQELKKLRDRLGQLRILDPACGSGNFLIVAYRELRQIELQILIRLQELGDTKSIPTLYFEREDLKVQLGHIAGIELEEWPAQIARTALRLVDHQANMQMEAALGKAPETLPLDEISVIKVGNALTMDWSDALDPTGATVVVGNPPFLGHATRSPAQAQELRAVWGRKDIGRLDYVTGWFKKAIDYLADCPRGRFSFVSTNSIAQGEPVAALFRPIFEAGWRIRFAHQTFAWTSEAPGAAAVHCVITGFDREPKTPAKLFVYSDAKGAPTEIPVETQINAYLVDGPLILVEQRRKPLAASLPPLVFGNMPRDAGGLIVEAADHEKFSADPAAAKYLRKFVGARELINGADRWCLWMVDLDPADIRKSALLRDRLERVRKFRAASDAASTREMAQTPHLFGQRGHKEVAHLAVPRHSSELRKYVPAGLYDSKVIVSDAAFTAEDADGFAFAIISSSMFATWLKAIGGRLESRIRVSNTLVWNNFPLPELEDAQRSEVIAGGEAVLAARQRWPERSLADHYNPLTMTPELLKAHALLDKAVDRALGAVIPVQSNEQRLILLQDRFAELSEA